jgi:hypothetical protein
MKPTHDPHLRSGARRARFPLALTLVTLCLLAPAFASSASAEEPRRLPESWRPFAGSWLASDGVAPSWQAAGYESPEAMVNPAPRISVRMVGDAPAVTLTRYKMQVALDGTFRYLPVRTTAKGEIQGETLIFRVQNDDFPQPCTTAPPATTEWRLARKDGHRLVLTSSGGAAPVAAMEMWPIADSLTQGAEGC